MNPDVHHADIEPHLLAPMRTPDGSLWRIKTLRTVTVSGVNPQRTELNCTLEQLTDAETDADPINELCEALRLTAEYARLPAVEGWSWYDALRKYRPDLVRPDPDQPAAGPTPPPDDLPDLKFDSIFRSGGQARPAPSSDDEPILSNGFKYQPITVEPDPMQRFEATLQKILAQLERIGTSPVDLDPQAPGGSPEDYIRACAKSVGVDPEATVQRWREGKAPPVGDVQQALSGVERSNANLQRALDAEQTLREAIVPGPNPFQPPDASELHQRASRHGWRWRWGRGGRDNPSPNWPLGPKGTTQS